VIRQNNSCIKGKRCDNLYHRKLTRKGGGNLEVKILIVDDSKLIRSLLKTTLESELNCIIDEAKDGEEALFRAKLGGHDLIILDIFLPDVLGINLINQLIDIEKDWVPIIMITSAEDKNLLKEALEKGAIDYIRKPFDDVEILARVKAALRTKKLYNDLKEANEALKEMAITDDLTKLYNRRYVMSILGIEFRRSKRYKTPLSIIIGDIDRFKNINDRFGHLMGDEVLKNCARIIKENIREIDIAGRYGGEEFLVILPNTPLDGAVIVAERLRCKVSQYSIEVPCEEKPIRITMSFGVCSYPEAKIETEEDMLKAADEALYISKQESRNQTTFYIHGRFITIPKEAIRSEA